MNTFCCLGGFYSWKWNSCKKKTSNESFHPNMEEDYKYTCEPLPSHKKKINSFEPAKDKRKNRWTRAATWGGHQRLNQKLTGWKMSTTTYHPERSDWHDAVAPVAVGPGVPAGVLSFLQYEHLTGHVLLLIPDPAGEADKQIRKRGNLKCAVTHSVSNTGSVTYGPISTRMEPILSMPFSHRLRDSPNRSILRPWKFSYS